MTGSASLQMGAIAAVYLLWLVSWLVLGHEAFGPARYNWDQTLVATVAAIAAFNASRQALKPYPVFLIMIGIGLAMLTASWFTYDPDDTRPFLRFPGQGAPDYSAISYALFVFVWVCAWGYLALKQWQRRPPSVLTGVVFAVLIFGLAVILANFYYPQYRSSLDTIAGRLDAVTSGLEFAALVIGLACILLGEPAVLTWMLFATALLVASDMAYSEADVPSAIEPVWMLGQFLLLSALLVFPGATEAVPPQSKTRSSLEEVAARQRSGLSGVLILLSLGGVLLSVAIGLVSVHPIWKSFFSVLFVVALVVALVWLTDRFDEAVQYLKTYTTRLHQKRLQDRGLARSGYSHSDYTTIHRPWRVLGLAPRLCWSAEARRSVFGTRASLSRAKTSGRTRQSSLFHRHALQPRVVERCPPHFVRVRAKPRPSSRCAETTCLPPPTSSLTSGIA